MLRLRATLRREADREPERHVLVQRLLVLLPQSVGRPNTIANGEAAQSVDKIGRCRELDEVVLGRADRVVGAEVEAQDVEIGEGFEDAGERCEAPVVAAAVGQEESADVVARFAETVGPAGRRGEGAVAGEALLFCEVTSDIGPGKRERVFLLEMEKVDEECVLLVVRKARHELLLLARGSAGIQQREVGVDG